MRSFASTAVIRRNARILSVLTGLALIASIEVDRARPTPASGGASLPPPAGTATPAPGKASAFVHSNSLWLYSLEERRANRLAAGGREAIISRPQFVTRRSIAFVRDGRLVEMDLRSRRTRLVLRGPVLAYDWLAREGLVAALLQPGGTGAHVLLIYDVRRHRRSIVRRFPYLRPRGEGAGNPPETVQSLEWSASGRQLLLVDTTLAARSKTMHVFARSGRKLIAPRAATSAGWLTGSTIYFRDLAVTRWHRLDVRTSMVSQLAVRGRSHAVASPDGRYLALDDSRPWRPGRRRAGCTCTTFLYDVARNSSRPLGRHFVAPIWISNDQLAATAVRACRGSECGVDAPMWVSLGRASLLSVDGQVTETNGFRSTLDAAVSG